MSLFSQSTLQSIFEFSLKNFYSAALVDGEGQPLSIHYQNLTDIGTYPSAAQISHKYMQIADGDAVLLNDPYSGGSILSTMTLVMGVDVPTQSKRAEGTKLLLCARVAFKPKVVMAQSIEEEGIRIPPAPIFHDGKINAELVAMISDHPSCPTYFESYVSEMLQKMSAARETLLSNLAAVGVDLTKKRLKEFHQASLNRARLALSQLSIGEAKVEIPIGPQQKIALRVEVGDEHVLFDFTNTTDSQVFHLTDSATLGACAGALFAVLNRNVPINAGSLRVLEVVAPQGSLVNARYPAPVFVGLTDGASLIASLVVKLLGRIDSRISMAQTHHAQCALELNFTNRPHYFDFLESGVAGSREQEGLSGFDLWKRSHLNPSIEQVENLFPVQVKTNDFRQKSGGTGERSGGNGVTRVLEVRESASMKWILSPPLSKPEGFAGGKAASGPEVLIQRKGSEKQKLENFGETSLNAGDLVILNSAGGGGFGEQLN